MVVIVQGMVEVEAGPYKVRSPSLDRVELGQVDNIEVGNLEDSPS